jgi:hypothetical protein
MRWLLKTGSFCFGAAALVLIVGLAWIEVNSGIEPDARPFFAGGALRKGREALRRLWMVFYPLWIQRICLPILEVGGKLAAA